MFKNGSDLGCHCVDVEVGMSLSGCETWDVCYSRGANAPMYRDRCFGGLGYDRKA